MLKSVIYLFLELAYLDSFSKLTPFDGASQYGSGAFSYDGGSLMLSKKIGRIISISGKISHLAFYNIKSHKFRNGFFPGLFLNCIILHHSRLYQNA